MTEPVDLETVRDHVGSTPDDSAIYGALNRFPATDPQRAVKAALVILRRRLADIEADYASFSVEGDASWSRTGDQTAGLRARIGRLERLCGDAETATDLLPVMTSTPLHTPPGARTPDPCRLRQ